MKGIAKKVKKMSEGFNGDARLFKVDPPVKYPRTIINEEEEQKETNYVIVSAAQVPMSGPETYIFPADEEGKVLDWGELEGSFQGALNHREALKNAGYEIEL